MITKFKIILLFILVFLFPIKVDAYSDINQIAKLKDLASNINVSYDYQIVGTNALFDITFSNVSELIYIRDLSGYAYYGNINGEVILNQYSDGQSYMFKVYGTGLYNDVEVGTVYVNLPSYNAYYKLSICDDAKEYKLCQKWSSHKLTRNEFIQNVQNYKNKEVIIDDSALNKKISVPDFLISFLGLYGIYILIGVVLAIIIVKVIRYKKDTFGF